MRLCLRGESAGGLTQLTTPASDPMNERSSYAQEGARCRGVYPASGLGGAAVERLAADQDRAGAGCDAVVVRRGPRRAVGLTVAAIVAVARALAAAGAGRCRGDVGDRRRCNSARYFAFAHVAVAWVPAGRTAILANTTTIWIVPLSLVFLHERIPPRRWVAAGLGLAGVVVLMSPLAIDWTSPQRADRPCVPADAPPVPGRWRSSSRARRGRRCRCSSCCRGASASVAAAVAAGVVAGTAWHAGIQPASWWALGLYRAGGGTARDMVRDGGDREAAGAWCRPSGS